MQQRWLGLLIPIALVALGAPARAVSFGPFSVVPPSAITPDAGPPEALSGSITLDVAAIPVAAATLFQLTGATVAAAGGASFTLDPAVASPALGVVQPGGSFLIPTLFLRVHGGAGDFDLAVPNVTGTLAFGAGGAVAGIASSFDVDSGSAAGILHVSLVASVPEPGTALLAALGLAALVLGRTREEDGR